MFIPRFECPICYNRFDTNPKVCPHCGYIGIQQYIYEFENKEQNKIVERDELFNILKFTKAVYTKKIPFEKDVLDIVNDPTENATYVMGAAGNRGLSIIDLHNDTTPVIAEDGILAFEHTRALIINTDRIKNNFLDESQVRILFFGPNVKELVGGYFQRAYLKYIFVDSRNRHFSAENNVLFNKNKTRLILYPSLKNEAEYRVPNTVKEFSPGAFRFLENLKTLYIPKSSKFTDKAIGNAINPDFKIIFY